MASQDSEGRLPVSDMCRRPTKSAARVIHLTPKTMETLICLQDWMRVSGSSKFCMEVIEDFDELSDPEK
ncbi:hypothetical protein PVAP13_7NG229785 [Panicum virgatum]|uniref:Uncharacterized protein n=1 Tax=Panicum virgatum TaxID=38727 RepID=A0A8T0PYG6_PANVG|nr:hypothetical protein PVAP13_7NG229785 [Panicum virgatum]